MQLKFLRRQRSHPPDCFLKRYDMLLSHIFSKDSRVRSITPWMRNSGPQYTDRCIAGKHVERILHDAFNIFLAHSMKHGTGSSMFDNAVSYTHLTLPTSDL